MQKYNARVIYQQHDDDGIIEIVEADGMRSLHFGSDAQQSSILLNNKNYLCLGYIRAMMSWYLYRENFDRALVIGLGGGSLPRYLLQQFTASHMTIIEQRSAVVKAARRFFDLPLDRRLKIITGDGGLYIRNAALADNQFDLLFIDAFAHDAVASSINGCAFFDACRQILSAQGVMVINLWNTDKALFEHIALTISQSFDEQLLFLPVKQLGNVILFAFPEKLPTLAFNVMQKRARQLEAVSGIEYTQFAQRLKKNNPNYINQLLSL